MKVNIVIDCTDIEDVYTHLDVIKEQLKKKLDRINLDAPFKPFKLSDNNCYGFHKVEVEDDWKIEKP